MATKSDGLKVVQTQLQAIGLLQHNFAPIVLQIMSEVQIRAWARKQLQEIDGVERYLDTSTWNYDLRTIQDTGALKLYLDLAEELPKGIKSDKELRTRLTQRRKYFEWILGINQHTDN